MLEGGHGGEVLGLLGRPRRVVRRVELGAVDGDGGVDEGGVVRALAPVGVLRRRPPPLVAQLLQPRLEHSRDRSGRESLPVEFSRWGSSLLNSDSH